VACSFLVVLVASGACDGSRVTAQYGSAQDAANEYRDEARRLQLAPGWTWPADPAYAERTEDGALQMYETNLGRVDAAWYWHCSWGRTFFSALDPAEQQLALKEVLALRESAFYRWGLDELGRIQRNQVLDSASEGRIEELRQIIELNCPAAPR
jgi:hypothetical protein